MLNIPGIKKSIHELGLISGLEYLGEWDQARRFQNEKKKKKTRKKEGHYQRAGKQALNPSAHHHSVGGYQKHYRNFSSLQDSTSNLSATVSVCITKASWFSITPWKATVSLLPAQHPAATTPEHNRFYSFHLKKSLCYSLWPTLTQDHIGKEPGRDIMPTWFLRDVEEILEGEVVIPVVLDRG